MALLDLLDESLDHDLLRLAAAGGGGRGGDGVAYRARVGEAPRLRSSVRVLLVDGSDRVLLGRSSEPDTGAPFWFPPGGGTEPGEDLRAAARREIAEEAGLEDLDLGPEVWRRRHVFTWRGTQWDQREHSLLARVPHFEPVPAALTPTEREDLDTWRWWTLDELDSTTDRLVPRDLARRLRELLADGPPPAPIDVGV